MGTETAAGAPVIVIADDHPLFRGALRAAIAGAVPDAVFTEMGTFDQLQAGLKARGDIDLVILDLTIPGVQGLSGLMTLRSEHPAMPVMIVSANDDPGIIRRCMAFGAAGFMPKTLEPQDIGRAVRSVLNGDVWAPPDIDLAVAADAETSDAVKRLMTLTPQQVRVLLMVSEGLLNKQIAFELNVSEATIKAHVSAILQKLSVDSRTQAVILASRIGASGWTSERVPAA